MKKQLRGGGDKETVRLFPLGGIEGVTKNMFVYEYRVDGKLMDLLLVDCGIGFPDEAMYGVDLVIPDISYLKNKQDKIRGLVLTHGHEDHIGALPYVLPKLKKFPLYATRLTAAFAKSKLKEFGINTQVREIKGGDQVTLGPFRFEGIHVTHSIPDAAHIVIYTPAGIFYHGSDFKFDLTPLDGYPTDLARIGEIGKKRVLCTLSDCLGSEREGYTLSERVIEDTIEDELRRCTGKFIFTTQSSNISRIQLAIDIAIKHNRKIAFIGRSIDKNTQTARKIKYMEFPEDALIYDKQILRHSDDRIFLIVAGSQGQLDSGLSRIARGEHKYVKLRENDVVLISADPIPGNETAVSTLIETLSRAGVRVAYSDIIDEVHVSGHGSRQDLRLLLSLTQPRYALPIGGTYKHMTAYRRLAIEMGYEKEAVLIPREGEIIEFSRGSLPQVVDRIETDQIMIDGLGIGDVGDIVLRDRQTLATEGIVVIVVPVEKSTSRVTSAPDIVSRGFVYMKESGKLVEQTKKVINKALKLKKGRIHDWHYIKRQIEERVAKFLHKETGRRPLIVPVLVEV